MKKIVGKIIDEDEVILKLYASGEIHTNTTLGGTEILVGCISLNYLTTDYKNKRIEIWVREI